MYISIKKENGRIFQHGNFWKNEQFYQFLMLIIHVDKILVSF